MTYDQWKTDSGYSEKTPEQENKGLCNCYYPGDCDGSCTHPKPKTNIVEEASKRLRENLASFDAEVACELANEGERADLWADIDVNVEDLRIVLAALTTASKSDAYHQYTHMRACNAEDDLERLRAAGCSCKGTDDYCPCQNT